MMSKMWKPGTLVAIALTATATLAAQQPPPPASRRHRRPQQTRSLSPDVFNAGFSPCRTTGAGGAAAAADASKFLLTKASAVSDATATPKTYRLDAEDSQLTAHVGHKVEITGTLEREAGRRRCGGAREAEGRLGKDDRRQLLRIDSLTLTS
jgi:hypothetical protein